LICLIKPGRAWVSHIKAATVSPKFEEQKMQAWKDFFTTDYGLMSALVILIVLGMAGFFINYFTKHIREDTEREAARQRAAGRTA
jgi:predicted negative regulator of RcsB-dependent stress response